MRDRIKVDKGQGETKREYEGTEGNNERESK